MMKLMFILHERKYNRLIILVLKNVCITIVVVLIH